MSDAELLAYCGQRLMDMRCVCRPLHKPLRLNKRPPSNGLAIGGLSDYSTLLESLQKLRYAILSDRNDQVPVNRLPVEILMLICELSLPPDPQSTEPYNKRVFCIMKLTHVCRRWRLVLISSPALWTDFHVVKTAPKFVAECLQRSGTLPIHVSFKWDGSDPDYDSPSTSVADDDGSVADTNSDVSGDDGSVVDEGRTNQTYASSSRPDVSDDETASNSTLSIYPDHRDTRYSWTAYMKEAQGYHHLMQHSHRIATLDVSFPAPVDDEDEEEDSSFACGLLFYPFPTLQTLKLRCSRGSLLGAIPKVILDEHIPTVKSLLLENILPTQIADFSLNITSLNLTNTGFNNLIDTSLFLRFLERNRSLQSLTLHNYKFPPSPEPVTPVALVNLRQLDVLSDSAAFLQHLTTPPLGPQSFIKMKKVGWRLLLCAENGAVGTSASISTLSPSDPNEFLSMISEVFGSGWEEATQVVVVVPAGGWEREFVDRFLGHLTRVEDLSVECKHGRVDPWFDSLAASKERCPKLRRIRLDIVPEDCPKVLRTVRKLVKQRAGDGIPLEMVQQTGLSSFTASIWDDLYNRWRVEDYLVARDS